MSLTTLTFHDKLNLYRWSNFFEEWKSIFLRHQHSWRNKHLLLTIHDIKQEESIEMQTVQPHPDKPGTVIHQWWQLIICLKAKAFRAQCTAITNDLFIRVLFCYLTCLVWQQSGSQRCVGESIWKCEWTNNKSIHKSSKQKAIMVNTSNRNRWWTTI